MNGKIINSIFVLLLFAMTSLGQLASGGSFSLEKSVIAGGGGESSGGGFKVGGTSGQNAAGTSTQNFNFSQTGGFWSPAQLVPTAATVSVSGRVATASGKGIRNVIVTLTDSGGGVRSAVTASFGFYRFTDVEVGQTYILQVRAKRYSFPNPTQVVTVNDELTDIDFTAEN
jgi:hypothetical protein